MTSKFLIFKQSLSESSIGHKIMGAARLLQVQAVALIRCQWNLLKWLAEIWYTDLPPEKN